MNSHHLTLVVDSSGSMGNILTEAQQSINTLIQDQKAVKGKCSFLLYDFATRVREIYDGPISVAPSYKLIPSDFTALRDAIGIAIVKTGDLLKALPKKSRPNKVTFVVVTDGYENASQEYTKAAITKMIAHQTEKYSWDFVFLAAGLDVAQEGVNLGFSAFNTVVIAPGSGMSHTAGFAGVSDTITRSRSGQAVAYAAAYDASGKLIDNDPLVSTNG